MRHEMWALLEKGVEDAPVDGRVLIPVEELKHLLRIARAADDLICSTGPFDDDANYVTLKDAVRACD